MLALGLPAAPAAGAGPDASSADATDAPAPAAAAAPPPDVFPHVTFDAAARRVGVRGSVIGADGVEWLELLACSAGLREHESVVRLDADARHVHAALLLLGLTPGAPADAELTDDGLVRTPPHGPGLDLWLSFDGPGGPGGPEPAAPPVAAAAYVAARATGVPLAAPDAPGGWVFAGSRTVPGPQRDYFLAHENGTLASLVNFGDDLIARPNDLPADGGNDAWVLHPAPAGAPPLPPAGTGLTLWIGPSGPAADAASGSGPAPPPPSLATSPAPPPAPAPAGR